MRVRSITSAFVLVVTLDWTPVAAPTGTILAYVCDYGTVIKCKVDYNVANNSTSGGGVSGKNGVSLGFLAGAEVEVEAVNCLKYGVVVQGDIDCNIKVTGWGVAEIFKIYGCTIGLTGTIRGSAIDDTGTIQPQEPSGFIGYMACQGHIDGVVLRDGRRRQATGSASGSVVVYTDPDYRATNVVWENEEVDATLGHALFFRDGAGFTAATSSRAGVFTVRRGRYRAIAGQFVVYCSTYIDELVIDRAELLPAGNVGTIARTITTSGIKRLRFLGLNLTMFDNPATTVIFSLDGANDLLLVEDCTFTGLSATSRARIFGVGAATKRAVFRRTRFDTVDTAIASGTGASVQRIEFDDVDVVNTPAGLTLNSSCSVDLMNSRFDTMSAGLVRPNTSGIVVDVDERGCSFVSAAPIVCLNGATANPKSPTLPIDIGATGILSTLGNRALHTGSTRQGILTGTPAIATGSSWRDAKTNKGSQAVTGATPAVNLALGNVVTETIAAATTFGAPSNIPPAGDEVVFALTQDATGGFAVSWNAAYVFPTAFSNTGNTANKKTIVTFKSDGAALVAQGANSWY